MGRVSGDKGRYYKQRRKKLARRVKMRALGASAAEKPDEASKAGKAAEAS